jgi:hypothetical protein
MFADLVDKCFKSTGVVLVRLFDGVSILLRLLFLVTCLGRVWQQQYLSPRLEFYGELAAINLIRVFPARFQPVLIDKMC